VSSEPKVARRSGPVEGGAGWPYAAPPRETVEQRGCVVEEFIVEGIAGSYEPAPGTATGADGQWTVRVTGDQGSGILSSMSQANCFILLPDAQGNTPAGTMVDVQLLEGLI